MVGDRVIFIFFAISLVNLVDSFYLDSVEESRGAVLEGVYYFFCSIVLILCRQKKSIFEWWSGVFVVVSMVAFDIVSVSLYRSDDWRYIYLSIVLMLYFYLVRGYFSINVFSRTFKSKWWVFYLPLVVFLCSLTSILVSFFGPAAGVAFCGLLFVSVRPIIMKIVYDSH